jgi:hypothetical protein
MITFDRKGSLLFVQKDSSHPIDGDWFRDPLIDTIIVLNLETGAFDTFERTTDKPYFSPYTTTTYILVHEWHLTVIGPDGIARVARLEIVVNRHQYTEKEKQIYLRRHGS